jgi:hypothetical protein
MQSDVELELVLKHPVVYPILNPSDATGFVDAVLPSIMSLKTPGMPAATGSAAGGRPQPGRLSTGPSREASQEAIPEPPPSYCDPRVACIDISYWTTVPIPDVEAAKILSLYLETDHPCMACFDADLFLKDMVAKQVTFCSPLLVCSLFAWACVSTIPRAVE